ncbi:hypothetical protein [Rippkaea orientalis]|uniref:hypothetical protein n=1 Tax=Rippkaea orientalis TaxID=2546366 RepID=UPI000172380C|nr:hypothetical protein [Rippkaea orientalis]
MSRLFQQYHHLIALTVSLPVILTIITGLGCIMPKNSPRTDDPLSYDSRFW